MNFQTFSSFFRKEKCETAVLIEVLSKNVKSQSTNTTDNDYETMNFRAFFSLKKRIAKLQA